MGVWYSSGMELIFESGADGTQYYRMNQITVDGMFRMNNRDYGYQIMSLKPDYWDTEDRYEDNGYIDDADVFWESPYAPLPFSLGEIDEELWMQEGTIRGKLESDNWF